MSHISPSLDSMLRRVYGRALRLKVAMKILHMMAIFLGTLFLAFALDAWLALPTVGLVALDVLAFVLVVLSVVVVVRVRRRNRYQAEAVALLIHEQLELPSGRLINAVEFSLVSPPGTSASLVESAIRRGEELATTIDPLRVVDGAVLRRPMLIAGAAVLACLLSIVLVPGVFVAVGARLVHPLSDLPPFTRLSFNVAVEPVDIYVGQPAVIKANVTGPELQPEASVVFLDTQGRKSRTPMWREIAVSQPGAKQNDALTEATFSLRIENLPTSFDYYIDTPCGRSAWQRLEVLRNPLIERVTVNYQPPAYTGWKPVLQTLGTGGIRALRRTQVEVKCRSNVALAGGVLELSPGKSSVSATASRIELVADPADSKSVTGSFAMEWGGSFVLNITGADGRPGARPVSGRLDCLPDSPPQVSIQEPEPVSVAPEGWKVPVRIESSDDVGVAGLTLMTRVGTNKFEADGLPDAPEGQPVSRTAVQTMDLALMGAKPGMQVHYFAIARDNEPEDGKTAETAVQTLMVITWEEYIDIARAGYNMESLKEEWGQFLGRLDELAKAREQVLERLTELEKQRSEQGGASPADRAQMRDLENALRSYEEGLQETSRAMQKRIEALDLYDVEQVYKEKLRSVSQQLDAQAGDAQTLHRALAGVPEDGATQPPDFAKAAEQFRANNKPFGDKGASEQLQGDMDKIDKAARLSFLADRLQSIIERQRDLAERLSSADPAEGKKPDQARLEKLGSEQGALEKELRETVDELDRGAGECGKALPRMSASARRLVNAARKLAAWDDQSAAASACPGQPKIAAERSENAATKLETLQSECKSNGGEMSDELDSCLSLSKKQGPGSVRQMMRGMQMGLNMGMSGRGSKGGGSMGSMATVGMVGPRLPSNSKSMSTARSGDGADGRGQQKSTLEKQAVAVDAIQAESSIENTTDARQIPGVPRAYRDLVEAYFRRLARDAVDIGNDSKAKPEEEKK